MVLVVVLEDVVGAVGTALAPTNVCRGLLCLPHGDLVAAPRTPLTTQRGLPTIGCDMDDGLLLYHSSEVSPAYLMQLIPINGRCFSDCLLDLPEEVFRQNALHMVEAFCFLQHRQQFGGGTTKANVVICIVHN